MKRDWDLVRKMLGGCENAEHEGGKVDFAIPGYSEIQIRYHVHLIMEIGLTDGFNHANTADLPPNALPTRLTQEGRDFLEASRDEGRWQLAKQTAAAAQGIPFDDLKAALVEELKLAVERDMGTG